MDAADRLVALVDALAGEPDVTPPDPDGPRRFGSRTLRVDGATSPMVVRGALVLERPEQRVAALLADGTGSTFGKDAARPYREWVALPGGEPVTDLPLAREALAFTRSRRR